MRLAALVSGGKDSIYATYLAGKEHEITYVISMVSENPASYMFHFPNVHLVKTQAALMGIPLIEKRTKGVKEEELDDLEDAIASLKGKIDGVVTGALASSYQKMRIDSICKRHDLLSIAPLWHRNPEEYLRSALKDGFDIIYVAVAAPPLDDKWLGRKLDEQTIDELVKLNLKHGIHIGGEGGELDSLVLDCPLFLKKIKIVHAEKNWNEKERSGTYDIKDIELVDK
ncbi:MAG: TIGR00289 family protein [Candidatus Aenigmarchaeota archaeon]|nr:TIGR00289 family protein [Candidatus Aenigmarchaeota archaeon]